MNPSIIPKILMMLGLFSFVWFGSMRCLNGLFSLSKPYRYELWKLGLGCRKENFACEEDKEAGEDDEETVMDPLWPLIPKFKVLINF